MSVLSFFLLVAPLLFTDAARAHIPSARHDIIPRQTNPTSLPANWSLVGCFTDISTARTLAANSLINNNVSVDACIAFCTAADYIFAGVEFGRECYCDSTIQIPGAKAPLTDCNMACAGNPSELCGGSGRLTVFTSGDPSPVLVPTPSPDWTLQGCLTDDILNRTLPMEVNVPVGVTAESCTAACQSAGAFTFAGLENGHECWCGNATNTVAQHVSNDDCRAVCVADHSEYCGNANRLALYNFLGADTPPPPVLNCTGNVGDFTLVAVFNNPPLGFPTQMNLRAVLVEMVPNTFWTILSACETCCSDWPSFSLQNSVFMPRSASDPTQSMTSIGPSDGESAAFVASIPAFPGAQAYCAAEVSTNPNTPMQLSFGGKTDSWSLCTNSTFFNGNGRVDLVFEPVTNHPHYAFSSCNAVTVHVIQS
ncbi:WSC domain-containing protein [Mycena pura]|uniref:WSC domain-containing protein n=1 Tax=Mycena pura TaxID=153505 RepID=A0AAD6YK74_9AGAR|nr:WSC domain-containing protein [Mycena pura]